MKKITIYLETDITDDDLADVIAALLADLGVTSDVVFIEEEAEDVQG